MASLAGRACAAALLLLTAGPGCSVISRTLRPLGLAAGEGYAYEVEIVGVGGILADRLEEASILYEKSWEPPANLQGLKRRAQSDREIFLKVMRSRGFYEGTVTWEIDSEKKPAVVSMKVTRGGRYKFSRIEIQGLPAEAADLATEEGLLSLGLAVGEPALAEAVLGAEDRLLVRLPVLGFPYAERRPREARIDSRAKTMDLVLRVDAGPATLFGDVTIEGLETVNEDYVRRRLAFSPGEPFSPAKVEETRKALFASGVFSGISLGWGKRGDVAPDGRAPIRLLVSEGDMRTVGAGLKYSSAEGVGGRAFWEHRNLSGRADKLRTELEISQLVNNGGVSYRLPDFWSKGQNLLLDARADDDRVPAYDRFAIGVSAGVERPLTKRLTATAGLAIEQTDVNSTAETGGTSTFTLIGVPLGLRYDGSDDLLDPSRGHRTLIGLTPWVSVLGDGVEMLLARLTESFYIPLTDDRRWIWATRLSLGSVIGPERSEVPADKRLYAGGGDSVRGYEYQLVGPLVDMDPYEKKPDGRPNWKPLGGRSLLQTGTELRWKVTENFGLVPFVEGAGVFDSSYPDFQEDMRWAAGLGVRYFTVAGPIRFDIGVPINPRQADGYFQIYISLGQAF
ncbi:MAG: autotransporter assembly complex family protein [Candidatus Binatia bacterium]